MSIGIVEGEIRMAKFFYGTLKLDGDPAVLRKLVEQLERLDECCAASGAVSSDYLPAIFEDYPEEQWVFCDGWDASDIEIGHLELRTRGQYDYGDSFAAILCRSLGISGKLRVGDDEGNWDTFEFSFDEDVPVCNWRVLDCTKPNKQTWRYTLVDPYGNLCTVERDTPPTTVSWEYICRDYHFGAESREKAEMLMVKHFEAHSPYRGFCQIAKHFGYTLVSVDTDGNRYIRCGNDLQGPFMGEDE